MTTETINLLNLPPEILHQICLFLGDSLKSLSTLSISCKQLSQISREILYRTSITSKIFYSCPGNLKPPFYINDLRGGKIEWYRMTLCITSCWKIHEKTSMEDRTDYARIYHFNLPSITQSPDKQVIPSLDYCNIHPNPSDVDWNSIINYENDVRNVARLFIEPNDEVSIPGPLFHQLHPIQRNVSLLSRLFSSRRWSREAGLFYVLLDVPFESNHYESTHFKMFFKCIPSLDGKYLIVHDVFSRMQCHECGNLDSRVCGGCKQVLFCSLECSRSCWMKYHKYWCGAFRHDLYPRLERLRLHPLLTQILSNNLQQIPTQ